MRQPPARAALALLVAAVVAGVVALAGCTKQSGAKPAAGLPDAAPVVAGIAAALSNLDISGQPILDGPGLAQTELGVITDGMARLKPTVTPGAITYTQLGDKAAVAHLAWSWPTRTTPWRYETAITLKYAGSWQWAWSPSDVQKDLTADARLQLTTSDPKRGAILGKDGVPIVDWRPVVRIGLDKTYIDASQWDASARALAKIVSINEDDYAAAVRNAGAKAFVLAIVQRGVDAPAALGTVPGARAMKDQQLLSPYKGFAPGLLGVVGQPTDAMIAKSNGQLTKDDTVGLSGLQAWHDATLRGTPGVRVDLVRREGAPVPTNTAGQKEILPANVFLTDVKDGAALHTTLDVALQTKLEGMIADNAVKTALVMVQPSTGKVLAMAASSNGGDEQVANWGHYPPGSTFKIVSSLALLRAGFTPESPVQCPTSTSVNGYVVHNYPEYPAAYNGTIPLKNALAFSCNTAFVNATRGLPMTALKDAAASLGMGVDYDTGFTSFYGEVPAADSEARLAADSFGQGDVQAAPLTMAGVVASVAAGRTVVPWLVEGEEPKPTGAPLTAAEAGQLQAMMGQVVAIGSASELQGVLVGGKTGTAEFGTASDLKTHIWMVGYTADDRAIVAFGDTGHYGTDLAPLLRQALS